MPVTTYPGTVTPLRGLNSFTEVERDVLFGRDQERDELTKLITSEGFRAGLLYGEHGVGKSSLLRAGLIPHLRDHGVIALPCEDLTAPAASFARLAAQQTGLGTADGEQPIAYLARTVSKAMAAQLYLFVLDDADLLLADGDDRAAGELGDLFARVVTRSGGRARFLFGCASQRVHLFGQLERRTGSLFPPSSRFELRSFPAATAVTVLERTIALAGLPANRAVAQAIVDELGPASSASGEISPSELQLAALALRDLKIATVEQLRGFGGASELARHWITDVAGATGNEQAGLRLLAELATGGGSTPFAPDWIASRCGVAREFTTEAMSVLQTRGIVRPTEVAGAPGQHYRLIHESLAPRVREAAAPARAAARRAHELLGSKANSGRKLSLAEWQQLRREGLEPSSPDERAVIDRTRRFAITVASIAAALPILVIILAYIAQSGRYYLDVTAADGERSPQIVARSGRAGLGLFHWLGFGEIIAESGVTRAIIDDSQWAAIANHELSGSLAGAAYVEQLSGLMEPQHAALIGYATTANDELLGVYSQLSGEHAHTRAAWLTALAPIARATGGEIALVQQALQDSSPAVRAAALQVATSAARRHPGSYDKPLLNALTSDDAELRRLAIAAVRGLDQTIASELLGAALAAAPNADARAELLSAVAGGAAAGSSEPSASSATAIMASDTSTKANRARAHQLLKRAFAAEPEQAAAACVKLLTEDEAPQAEQLVVLALLGEHAPDSSYSSMEAPLRTALRSDDEQLRAAALPLFARVAPGDAALELAGLFDSLGDQTPAIRVAVALGWGAVAATERNAATAALEAMLKDPNSEVRAAAARAYGSTGRRAQAELVKLVKTERYEVALGAAWGLANSVHAGAPSGMAIAGIAHLWKRKGKARRDAARILADIAKSKPTAVNSYLSSASRASDDPTLRPIGAQGLCNAHRAGSKTAARELRRAAAGGPTEVRRIAIECMAHYPGKGAAAQQLAATVISDSDPNIRADAARVLAGAASRGGRGGTAAGASLVSLVRDSNKSVRLIAIRALAALGDGAPATAAPALVAAFERRDADQQEKLELLAAATALHTATMIPLALADSAPAVRGAAIEVAIATNTDIAAAVSAGLADADAAVRRATVTHLATGTLDASIVGDALAQATLDPEPGIAAAALHTFAAVAELPLVEARLRSDLHARSEQVRVRATEACLGLVARDADLAIALLEPLLSDPSWDVRTALVPALAAAYAAGREPTQIAKLLDRSEAHATRRLVTAAALVLLASNGSSEAEPLLQQRAKSGAPLVRSTAQLALGLLQGKADAPQFLAYLIP